MRPIYWDPRLHTGTDGYGVPSADDLMLVREMASVHLLHQAVGVAIRALRMVEDAPPRRLATHALATGIVALLHASTHCSPTTATPASTTYKPSPTATGTTTSPPSEPPR